MHGDIAGFGKFEQTAETSIPGHREAAADEGDRRASTKFAARRVWGRPLRAVGWRCGRTEQLGPNSIRRNALLPQRGRDRAHKSRWAAKIKGSGQRHTRLLQPRRVDTTLRVIVTTRLIVGRRAE